MSISAMSNSHAAHPAQPSPVQDTCASSTTEPLMRFLQNIAPRQSDPATSLALPLSPADYAYAALLVSQASVYNQQQQQPQRPSHFNPYHMLHAPVTVHLPIHHTLENATITYDTIAEQAAHRKHLVKDVFFSPAMTDDTSASSCCSQSDTESDVRVEDDATFSPPITLSDLLLEDDNDPLYYFGLDLDPADPTTGTKEISSCYPNLPTPPTFVNDDDDELESSAKSSGSLKRKHRSDSITANKKKRDPWQLASPTSTPPASPAFDYFEDASGEESSDDESDDGSTCTAKSPRDTGAKRAARTPLVELEDDDDSSSVSSWEGRRASMFDDDDEEGDLLDTGSVLKPQTVQPRTTAQPTIYQKLTQCNVDWCRYCGTTEGVNWRPGPWGKRTLCNKHGCDYKGYGFACKLPRLDLTGFTRESIDDRKRPVLQLYCTACQSPESWEGNVLVRCEGCPKAYHQKCAPVELSDAFVASEESWFCESACCDNVRRKRIVVELPRKRLPLMCAPKGASSSPSELRTTRSLRDSR